MDLLSEFRASSQMVGTIGELDSFKGRWEALGRLAPERLSSLRKVATVESVASSTRIEGVTLSDPEVDQLLSNLEIRFFKTRDEQEVAGYAELMELIFESWPEIPLSENHLFQLHTTLLKHSNKDERHRGRYKTLPNRVEAFDPEGQSLGVVFETASPFDTPGLTRELVDTTREELDSGSSHPLLVIGAFVVRFLAIHPFQDGNGRLSRALTTLLLLRTGYLYVPYSSLERVIEENKDGYYRALRRCQATLATASPDLEPWLRFFLDCLLQQKERLERRVGDEQLLRPMPPLSEKILEIVRMQGRCTVREILALTGANRNTIKHHLSRLVQAGQLVLHGRGKGSWYEAPRGRP